MTFLPFFWWLSIFWPSVLCYSALRSFLLLCSWIYLKIIRLFFYSTVFMLCCSVVSNSLRPSWTEAHQAPLHGIFPARILEWVAISSSRESSWPRDQTYISYVSCIGRQANSLPLCHMGSPILDYIISQIKSLPIFGKDVPFYFLDRFFF